MITQATRLQEPQDLTQNLLAVVPVDPDKGSVKGETTQWAPWDSNPQPAD